MPTSQGMLIRGEEVKLEALPTRRLNGKGTVLASKPVDLKSILWNDVEEGEERLAPTSFPRTISHGHRHIQRP